MKYILTASLAATAVLMALPATAQNYPDRAIKVVVPCPPGPQLRGFAELRPERSMIVPHKKLSC